ncbi:hypothetical protein HY604_03495 [Candidatus Peregrinibacteria bacterium]|nr:hypothetical protein [Candidatus Peregrinibacteria bacterium]
MVGQDLQLEILKLLKDSGVPEAQKDGIKFSLPFMVESDLIKMRDILMMEKKKIANARKEAKRIEMKYQFMIDDLAEMEIRKAK